MSILSMLQALEVSIKGFFVHAENIKADLDVLKKGLGVAEDIVNVVAPGSAVDAAIHVADTVVDDLENVVPEAVNNPQQ